MYKDICARLEEARQDRLDIYFCDDRTGIMDVALRSGVLEQKSLSFPRQTQIRMNSLILSIGTDVLWFSEEFFSALTELAISDELKEELYRLAGEHGEDKLGQHPFSKFECNI